MTTAQLRKAITVMPTFYETETTINIPYRFNGTPKFLIIDKKEDTELMQHVDGEVSQYDAINLVINHELLMSNKGYLDLTKPESLFESIASIVRKTNQAAYGI